MPCIRNIIARVRGRGEAKRKRGSSSRAAKREARRRRRRRRRRSRTQETREGSAGRSLRSRHVRSSQVRLRHTVSCRSPRLVRSRLAWPIKVKHRPILYYIILYCTISTAQHGFIAARRSRNRSTSTRSQRQSREVSSLSHVYPSYHYYNYIRTKCHIGSCIITHSIV